MPAIRLTDNSGLDVTLAPAAGSSFTRYAETASTIQVMLAGGEFSFKEPLAFSTGDVHFAVNLKLPGTIAVAQDYISLSIPALSGDSGSEIAVANYQPFPPQSPMAPAIQELFRNFIIPADVADLESLAEGSIATVEGSGSLKITAEADLPLAVNPLATAADAVLGALGARASGTVAIAAAYTFAGNRRIKVQRLTGGRVQLGFGKAGSSGFDVSVEAEAGASGESLLRAASSDPAAQTTVLTGDRKSAVDAAVKAGIERSLQLSLSAELGLLDKDSDVFSYEVEMNALDAAGRQAVTDALRGDLTQLESSTHSGITTVRSVLVNVRRSKAVLRLNLLGIFNFASVGSLMQNGAVIVDRDTGCITITDKITATRVGFAGDNFAKDGAKLRKMLADSVLITAAYRISAGVFSPAFSASQWFYELHEKTTVQDVRHYLNIAMALQVSAPAYKTIPSSPGPSQMLVDLQFNDVLFRSLFLSSAGDARPRQEYEDIARRAMLALLSDDDARYLPLAHADIWAQMKDKGQPDHFGGVLARYEFSPNELGDIDADYTLVNWWADVMHRMAVALEAILKYVAGAKLTQLRAALNRAAASVDQTTRNEFAEPFGLLALDLATGQRAAVDLRLTSPDFSFTSSRAATVI